MWTKDVIAFAKGDEKNEGMEILIDAIPLFEVLSITEMNQGASESSSSEPTNDNASSAKNVMKRG